MSLPVAERLGARSRCWIAPAGTKLTDAGWKPLGFTSLDGLTTPEQRAAKSAYDYSLPFRYVTGILPGSIELTLSDLSPDLVDLYFGKTTERSKPLGLTKDHNYFNPEDQRHLQVERSAEDERSVYINVADEGRDREAGIWLAYEDTIPLALNVLGWDKPVLEDEFFELPTTVGNYTANHDTPGSRDERDEHLAEAVDYLRGIVMYDQLQVLNAERDAKREAEAAAKREADYTKQKQESFDSAKLAYADAIRDQIASGIDADSTAKVQAALSAYETARRKFEGLPH